MRSEQREIQKKSLDWLRSCLSSCTVSFTFSLLLASTNLLSSFCSHIVLILSSACLGLALLACSCTDVRIIAYVSVTHFCRVLGSVAKTHTVHAFHTLSAPVYLWVMMMMHSKKRCFDISTNWYWTKQHPTTTAKGFKKY